PLSFATVNFQNTSIGTNTDLEGRFELIGSTTADSIVISFLGYQPTTVAIVPGQRQTIDVQLSNEAVTLVEATVRLKKERYRNKDNPAVDLIRKVIAHKQENDVQQFDYYEYEQYEKVMLGLSNLSEKFKNRKAFRKLRFMFEQLDTSSIPGQRLLPVYIKEHLADIRFRKMPAKKKTSIIADTMVVFKEYADNDGFNHYIDNLYQNVSLSENNVVILNQQFLSPIANSAPGFYKYYIQDTLQVDGVPCIELFFAPRNKLDMLFQGSLFIAYEDNYNLKKADLSINTKNSMNWIKSLRLVQKFEKTDGHGYVQTFDDFSADFGLTKKGVGMYGRRTVSNRDIRINQPRPDDWYAGPATEDVSETQDETFWLKNRHTPLRSSEAATYQKMDRLQKNSFFKNAMGVLNFMLTGYFDLTPYFEVGPVNTFYSFNPV
ncbi:MAG: DUF5686 family protein, partial [Bacteroidota bacterium]